jgi:RNA polymerase sigma factor (sigma-70 family)
MGSGFPPNTPAEVSRDENPAHPSSDSRNHLVERAERGDRSAVRSLIERAAPEVRRWARGRLPRYARNDANTEDVVQDAIVRIMKRLGTFRHRTAGGLQAYLRKSVVNRIRDLIRGSKRHGIAEELGDELRDPLPSPVESILVRERLDTFLAALHRMSPADRQVIIWRVELGYTVDEIAAKLGKSKAAAAMTVSRAMARLAKALNAGPDAV